jgi:hypothetical protein
MIWLQRIQNWLQRQMVGIQQRLQNPLAKNESGFAVMDIGGQQILRIEQQGEVALRVQNLVLIPINLAFFISLITTGLPCIK